MRPARTWSIRARPVRTSIMLLLVTIVSGTTIRFAPLGLPPVVTKFGGSTLWAVMLYWVVSSMMRTQRISFVALVTGVVAAGVELVKLYHSPALDSFRLTLPGMLLLGRFFSVWDIVAYWLAIAVIALLDSSIRAR